MPAVLMLTLVTLLAADGRPDGAAIFRAHEVLALCLEHAEQLPRATCFLFEKCHLLAVMHLHIQSYLEHPKPQVMPVSEGLKDRAQQAHRETAGALLVVREGLKWLAAMCTWC